jgi:NitT/TauT family transport system substrate-binding protein
MSPRRFVLPSLALSIVLAACSPVPSSQPSVATGGELRQVTLLLGFQPDVQFAPFYLAQQAGYFRDAGLEVTIEHSDDVIRLVADVQAEFGVADATDVMIARTSGIPIFYISTLYAHFPVALIGSPKTMPADPAGLAGLRIGTPGRFGSSWHALLALLDAGGLTADDVTIREYPQFNQVEGLLNGDVDLITGFRTNEPLRLEAQGFDVKLMTVDDFAPLPGPGIVVGDGLLPTDTGDVFAFADAVAKAMNAIADDPQVGLDAAIRQVPAIAEDEETALAVLKSTVAVWGTPVSGIESIDTDVWESGYQTMLRLGLIDGSVMVDEMYPQKIVEAR